MRMNNDARGGTSSKHQVVHRRTASAVSLGRFGETDGRRPGPIAMKHDAQRMQLVELDRIRWATAVRESEIHRVTVEERLDVHGSGLAGKDKWHVAVAGKLDAANQAAGRRDVCLTEVD